MLHPKNEKITDHFLIFEQMAELYTVEQDWLCNKSQAVNKTYAPGIVKQLKGYKKKGPTIFYEVKDFSPVYAIGGLFL